MKITDMNVICLEECLEHLELDDLLRVADSNKRLRKVAELVFLQKYGKKLISHHCNGARFIAVPYIEYNGLSIYNLKLGLNLLRCFGHLIKQWSYLKGYLSDYSCDRDQVVLAYLKEYCTESLTAICFYHIESALLNQLNKTFVNVIHLKISRSCIPETGWLNMVFPNLTHFGYDNCIVSNRHFIEDHFPRLEFLSVSMHNLIELSSKNPILDYLRLNPQLKTLQLGGWHVHRQPFFDENSLRNLIESMENLRELFLMSDFALLPNVSGEKIYSKSIRKFSIDGIYVKCPISFDRLEIFECWSQDMNDFYDFIDRHPTIKKILITDLELYWVNFNVTCLIKALPLLTEITLYSIPVSVDNLIDLVSGVKLLKRIELSESGVQNNLEELRSRLGDDWQIFEVKKDHLRIEKKN